MSNVSLRANINTNKVGNGIGSNLFTYRVQDPNAMMCPRWTGQDLAGREVCEYSFYTKRAGCNSAEDRIVVENFLRPKYTSYVGTHAAGIGGSIYDAPTTDFQKSDYMGSLAQSDAAGKSTGHFGYVDPGNGSYRTGNIRHDLSGVLGHPELRPIAPSADAFARLNTQKRADQAGAIGFRNHELKNNTNVRQTIHGLQYSVNPNESHFAMGPNSDSRYANNREFKSFAQ